MASGVNELLDMLFEMVDEAKNMPLSSDKCVLERDKALDLIDEIRGQFPGELVEAKRLLATRNDYLAAAKREADMIVSQAEERAKRLVTTAEERAKQLVATNELLAQIKQRGTEIIRQAEERSRELKKAANEYCEDALRRTEEAVAEAHDEIKKSRSRFRAAATSSLSSSQSPGQPFDAEEQP